jgi:DNA-binding CsgD family transcriptional regulator
VAQATATRRGTTRAARFAPAKFRPTTLPTALVTRSRLLEGLSAAELRILKLLPTSTYLQIAATLCISRNTVKSELRSIYQKLGASSRAEAIERAVELRLL